MFKKILKFAQLLLLVTCTFLFTHAAKADVQYKKTCDLAVYPYDSTSQDIIGDAGTPFINQIDNSCTSHISFPDQYRPQPPRAEDNPVKSGAENKRVPIAQHLHGYFNDSNKDIPDNNGYNYFYKSFVKKFEITIQPDGYNNIDLNRISCGTQVVYNYQGAQQSFNNCDYKIADSFGGTLVSTSRNSDNRTMKVTWTFGVDDPTKLPQVYGNNGASFFVDGRVQDLTNPNNRRLQFSVNLPTKDNGEIWSATTTSRVLLADLAILQSNFAAHQNEGCKANVNDPASGWCYIEPAGGYPNYQTEPVYTTTNRTYYWYNIGSVGSVWKKPPQPMPKLTLIKNVINDNGGALNANNFPLFINSTQAVSATVYTLQPGTYTVSETNQPGYVAGNWADQCAGGRVTLQYGDNKTCYITNDDIPPTARERPTLRLIKYVVNNYSGRLGSNDFPLYIDSNTAISGATYTLDPGRYTVREVNQPGYNAGEWSADCYGGIVDLNYGDNKVCTITNYDGSTPPPPPPPPPPPSNFCVDLQITPTQILRNMPTQSFSAFVTPNNFSGNITWTHLKNRSTVETKIGTRVTFGNLDSTSRVIANAVPATERGTCTREAVAEPAPIPTPKPPAGNIHKKAVEITSRGNIIKKNQTAEFQITFQPTSPTPIITLRDSMRDKIYGSESGEISLVKASYSGKDFKVEKKKSGSGTTAVAGCTATSKNMCFSGNPFTDAGITVRNIKTETLIITYKGRLTKSKINDEYCRTLTRDFCGEKFINEVTDTLSGHANATLFTPCPYILTRGIGDAILEQDLMIGSDISACAGIPNIEGPVVTPKTPDEPRTPKTGVGDILNIPSHTLCQKSNTDDKSQPEAYRNPLKRLSSAICEVSLTLADSLTPPNIRADVMENITRVTRFNNNLGIGSNVLVANLNKPPLKAQSPSADNEVYKLKNGNLTVDKFSPPVAAGSRTYVIENGDLIINGNIIYADTKFDLNNMKKIPSIAFIVINGNIKIAPNVTKLSGVFVALNGKITGTANSINQLEFTGTIYGDIEPLFASRSFVGNARRGQGTIVINYDGRLFYNMPPGLKEILDISEEQVAR